jgi:hypothetical protein
LPESRARESRLYIELAVQLNRELQLRDRLDKVCEMLKIIPDITDPEDDDQDLDVAPGATDDGS